MGLWDSLIRALWEQLKYLETDGRNVRRFGLDLSFATVEAWALSQGLNADMQKMTQAEKTMLRYQYVLANTGAAQGELLVAW